MQHGFFTDVVWPEADLNHPQLVVNADDFGLSPAVSRGIIRAHTHGIVTSTSLMVRSAHAAAAVAAAKSHPELSLGLHIDLGEWVCSAGEWRQLYHVCDLKDSRAIETEVRKQVDRFIELVGDRPTHLDSHQHIHRIEPFRSICMDMAGELGVPLRQVTPGIRYLGHFFGQSGEGKPTPSAIRVDALLNLLGGLQIGVTELACHPGYVDDLESVYRGERLIELETLCDGRIREVIEEEGIEMVSFGSVSLPA
jgi:predicted glycoside hydrolase/deacetylase ChbG (UPF0249 family)